VKRFLASVLIGFALVSPPRAWAHPLSQGQIQIRIDGRAITLNISVAVEEMIVQQKLPSGDDDTFVITSEACRKHGEYLLKHFFLTADNTVIFGALNKTVSPHVAPIHVLDIARNYVDFEITYTLNTLLTSLILSENVLNEMEYEPGNRWEVAYIARVFQGGKLVQENMLLSSTTPLNVTLAESERSAPVPKIKGVAQPSTPPAPSANPSVSRILALITALFCVIVLFIIRLRQQLNRFHSKK
jgi:hypothetical protein